MKEFLTNKRNALGLDIEEMAKRCECSKRLLYMLEDGGNITHPEIAARIAKEYGLSLKEYNALVHEKHRAMRVPNPKKHKETNWGEARRCRWSKDPVVSDK